MGSRFFSHHADFAPAHECMGQEWTEAIAVLNVRSAELRHEAAKYALGRSITQLGDHAGREEWTPLMRRAEHLDKLAHWLRDNMSLPEKEPE